MAKRRLRHLETLDPWLVICERCPLDDCCRPEGAYQVATKAKRLLYGPNSPILKCPITQAQLNDWSPDEVGEHIELRPAVDWLGI